MVLCWQPGSEGPLAQSRGSGAHTASPGSTAARGLQPQLLPGRAAAAGAGLESSCVSPGPGRFRAGWQQDRPGHSAAHGMSSSPPHARDTLPLPCPALSTAQRANPALMGNYREDTTSLSTYKLQLLYIRKKAYNN